MTDRELIADIKARADAEFRSGHPVRAMGLMDAALAYAEQMIDQFERDARRRNEAGHDV